LSSEFIDRESLIVSFFPWNVVLASFFELTSGLILLWEFGGFFFILLLAGSSIMIMLHHKKFNNLIIWCCVGTYFGPLIFDFLGFVTLKGFFFSYLNIIFPLISISIACFLYHKYASNQGSSEGEYNNVEMAD